MQIFRKKNRYDPQIFICCANIISQMNTFLSKFFSKTIKTNNYFFSREKFSFSNVHLGLYEAQKIFLSREKIFSLPIFKIFPPYQFFFLSIFLKKKYRHFFFKNMKPTIIFFQLLTCIVFYIFALVELN